MPPEECNLADQFIRHYFTLYDSDSRMKLEGLYHRDALFSLTSTYLPAQTTSNTARSVMELNSLFYWTTSWRVKILVWNENISIMYCFSPRYKLDFTHAAKHMHCVSQIILYIKKEREGKKTLLLCSYPDHSMEPHFVVTDFLDSFHCVLHFRDKSGSHLQEYFIQNSCHYMIIYTEMNPWLVSN